MPDKPKHTTFVGTAYKIDSTVEKDHPVELRTIFVHSEDEIPMEHLLNLKVPDDPSPSPRR